MAAQRDRIEKALRDVESRLRGRPADLSLKFERARLLDRLGRADEARRGYVDVLQRDADHFGALNDLGMLLFRAGQRADAATLFNAAVAKHPRNPIGHANLALVLLRGGDARGAVEHYEIAARLDGENVETRRGLALALEAVGEKDRAAAEREIGFRAQPIAQLPFRGQGRAPRVLLLVTAGPGNVPADSFLDDRLFAVTKAVAEFCDASTTLPAHDLILNAIGDADVAANALASAQALVERSGAPTVNTPSAVLRTGRAESARRFAEIPGVRVPRFAAFPRALLAQPGGGEALARAGFAFPLLLRSPGFHAGAHFERVENQGDVAGTAAALPGEELFAIEFIDVRGSDTNARKYRVMFVDGRLYPLHLAISAHWKVHYFSADMAQRAEHRAEEERFLRDPQAALGARAMAALQAICERSGLEYGGIDCTVGRDGEPIVFEANATMILPAPPPEPQFAYRREPIERVVAAVRSMLVKRSRVG